MDGFLVSNRLARRPSDIVGPSVINAFASIPRRLDAWREKAYVAEHSESRDRKNRSKEYACFASCGNMKEKKIFEQ